MVVIILLFSAFAIQHEWLACRSWWENTLQENIATANTALENGEIGSLSEAVNLMQEYYTCVDAVRIETNTFEYIDNEQSQGKTVLEAGYTEEILQSGSHVMRRPDGTKEHVATGVLQSEEGSVAMIISYSQDVNYFSVLQMIFALIAAVVAIYIFTIGNKAESVTDGSQNRKNTSDSKFANLKLSMAFAISLLVTLVYFASYCITNLNEAMDLEYLDATIRKELEYKTDERDALLSSLKESTETAGYKMAAQLQETDWELLTKGDEVLWRIREKEQENTFVEDEDGNPIKAYTSVPFLQQLCKNNGVCSIRIFNDSGYCVASSDNNWNLKLDFALESEDAPLIDTLERITSVATISKETENGIYVLTALPVTFEIDGEDLTYLLAVSSYPDSGIHTDEQIESNIFRTLENIFNLNIVIVGNDENHTVLYAGDAVSAMTLNEIGIPDEAFTASRFNSTYKNGGKQYFQSIYYTKSIGNDLKDCYVCLSTPMFDIIADNPVTYFGVYLLYVIAAILLIYLVLQGITPEMSLNDFMYNNRHGAQNSRLNYLRQQSVSERLKKIMLSVLELSFILCVLYIIGINMIFTGDKRSFLTYLMDNNWQRGLNLMSFLAMSAIIIGLLCVSLIGRQFYTLIAFAFSMKLKTVMKLIFSLLKYLLIMFALLAILWCYGMDIGGLLTSLGIISLILGLAAQDMIKDILAGSMIVFEDLFKIGDTIKIGDTVGKVEEISLRNCRILTWDGKVLTLNNTSITNFINLSKKDLKVSVTCQVLQSTPPEEFRKIMEEELPGISDRLSNMIANLKYGGITDYQAAGFPYYNAVFTADIVPPKGNVTAATRAINEEILSIGIKYKFTADEKMCICPIAGAVAGK